MYDLKARPLGHYDVVVCGGDPAEGRPNPASMSITLGGLPADFDGTRAADYIRSLGHAL